MDTILQSKGIRSLFFIIGTIVIVHTIGKGYNRTSIITRIIVSLLMRHYQTWLILQSLIIKAEVIVKVYIQSNCWWQHVHQ